MPYLSSAPAVGQSHSGLLPSTVAGPRGRRRTTRNCGLGEGKNAVTLTKGYPRTPSFCTGHLLRLRSAPAPERSWERGHRAGWSTGQLDPGPGVKSRPDPGTRGRSPPPLPRSHSLPQGRAPTSSIPEVLLAPGREVTGEGREGHPVPAPGPCPARGDPGSTWGARTNGKTDRREWEERGGQGTQGLGGLKAPGRGNTGPAATSRRRAPARPTWGRPRGGGVLRPFSAKRLGEPRAAHFPSNVEEVGLRWPGNPQRA